MGIQTITRNYDDTQVIGKVGAIDGTTIFSAPALSYYTLDLSGKTKAFDTSRHNHSNDAPIDFEQARADGYLIWIGRASVGNYYIDPWFAIDFDAARAAGFICLAYHVTTPEYDDQEQFEKFLQALDGRIPDGIVIDAELHRGQTAVRVTACNRYHAERFTAMLPGRVLFYTNQAFANSYLLGNFGLPLFVANPGPGGGFNYAPAPAIPDLWSSYIAWQKDWKHDIPGVPDSTTDYSEFEMSEAEAREYFWMDDDGDEDMSQEILSKLDQVLANQVSILAILNNGEVPEPPNPTPPPPVVPPADPEYSVQVIVEKANARWSKAQNANGLPIMQIYPRDNAPVSERIQYFEDSFVPVKPDKIKADGGAYYWELVYGKGRDGETLYLKADDVMKTW